MAEGITGIPDTSSHIGTKLFGEHKACRATAQEKYEQYRKFSFLFTVAQVVGSVNVPFVFKADREGGYTDPNAFFYAFFARRSRNEQTLMKKCNFS
jgi:hypothetical protein